MMWLIVGVPRKMGDSCHKVWQVWGSPGLFGLHHSPGLHPLEPVWWHSLEVGSVCSPSLRRWLNWPTRSDRGPTSKEWFSMKTWHDSIYLHIIIEEGHTALSINPYLGYIFDPIPLVEGIGIQEGSLCTVHLCLGHPLLGYLWLGHLDLRGLGSLLWCCPLLLV